MGDEANAMRVQEMTDQGADDFAEANLDPHKVPAGDADWHASRHDQEPRCAADQWRSRTRTRVSYVHEMDASHLQRCIRLASTMPQHSSRLASLLEEAERRKRKK